MDTEVRVATMIMTGMRAGKTFVFKKKQFVNGKLVLRGDDKQIGGIIKYLGRTIKAFPEGSPALQEAQRLDAENPELQAKIAERRAKENGERDPATNSEPGSGNDVSSDVPSGRAGASEVPTNVGGSNDDTANGDGRKLPAGSGPPNTGNGDESKESERIQAALDSLDLKNDEHWTQAGLPQLQAVEASVGKPVSRAEVSAARPDFSRP